MQVVQLSDWRAAASRNTVTVLFEGGLSAGARVLDALGCETIEACWADMRRTRLLALADEFALEKLSALERMGVVRVERVEG